MSTQADIQLKIWDPNDEVTINGILKSASLSHHQKENSPEWFKWKFGESPFGHSIISYAIANDGTIAGSVAFGMYEISHTKKVLKAALSYETFVHPQYQGRGLFTTLTKLAMEEARKRGVEILFNFPNTKSLPGFKKLGWEMQNCINLWVRPSSYIKFFFKLNLSALKQSFIADKADASKMITKQTIENLVYHKTVESFPESFIAHRTKEYLQWRFASYPLNNYMVLDSEEGACIIRTGKRGKYSETQIMEFFPKHDLNRKFLKATLKEVRKKINPDLITINVSKSHPANKLLYSLLFFPLPNKINFTYYSFNKEIIDTKNPDWIITGTEFHTY